MVVVAVVGLLVFSILHGLRHPENLVGISLGDAGAGPGVVVETTTPTGAAAGAGIRAGDRILEVGGERIGSPGDYARAAEAFGFEGPTPVIVVREGERRPLEVRAGSLAQILLRIPLVLLYLAIGVGALRLSPGYLNGRLLFYFTATVAFEFALPWSVAVPGIGLAVELTFYLLTGLQMGLLLHLSLLIPERPRWIELRPRVIPGLYGIGLTLAGVVSIPTVATFFALGAPWSRETGIFLFRDVAFPAWAVSLLVVLGVRAVTFPESEGRRQAGIVFLGTVPWAGWVGLMTLFRILGQPEPSWLEAVQMVGFFSYPLAVLWVLRRDARRLRRELERVGERAHESESPQEVAEALTTALESGLHPRWVAVFFRRRGGEPWSLEAFAGEESVAERLEQVESLDGIFRDGLPELEVETGEIRRLQEPLVPGETSCLCLALRGRGRDVLGLLLLGEKRSEEPYTAQNRRRLADLAGRVGLVLQNMELSESIRRSAGAADGSREGAATSRRTDPILARECPDCGRCHGADQDVCEECGGERLQPLGVEHLVATRYRLERRLGTGGMGAVFEAEDTRLGRRVALKALLPPRLPERALQRFEREARISARLAHPNIVSIYDFGLTEAGGAFLIMERLHGSSLRDLLRRYGRVTPETAAKWFEQILAGLEAAHREDVVHRDLKPANVFLVDRGIESDRLEILDFGLAKLRHTDASVLATVTRPGSVLGTLPYMAPEQLEGAAVDHRTDLFAVGVMVVEALTGLRPFRGGTAQAISYAIVNSEYSYPGEDPAARALDGVLQRCLAKDLGERPESAEELARELIPAIRDLPEPGDDADVPTLDLSP